MSHKAYDIFISYDRSDAALAEELADKLQTSGLEVWLDKWHITPGSRYEEAINRGLSDAAAVGVCVGPEGVNQLRPDRAAIQSHVGQNPAQVVVPLLVGGAAQEVVPEWLTELSARKSANPETDKLISNLALRLVSVGEFSAAAPLIQMIVPGDDRPGSLLDTLKRLFSKADNPKKAAASESADEATQDHPSTAGESGEDALVAMAEELLRKEAAGILRGRAASPRELLALAVRLKASQQFGYARRILARARHSHELHDDPALRLKIYQQSALCTYKDQELPADRRLNRALEILHAIEDINQTRNQETLGLVGAIYKRKWEVDNQKPNLERSLFYYMRGYAEGPEKDHGYNGINAAYILDLLAHQEEEEAERARVPLDSPERERIARRREQAERIRRDIIERVPPLVEQPDTDLPRGDWWFYSTIAEAYFGLAGGGDMRHYDTALAYLERGRRESNPPEWEFESAVRQLAGLARLQAPVGSTVREFENSAAWETLKKFLGGREAPVERAFIGKVGLGLSGGGFRASLYHIGVLAKLAELDVLRQVEVISCVSGGSVIGAHYYLEVRKLLQKKADEEITREDYVDIVRRVGRDFLKGVQRNVRTRVVAEPLTNLRMAFDPSYSRTMRAGELFESEIFSRVDDGGGAAPRFINDLLIRPKGEGPSFSPKYNNWRRYAKVPVLILNATTLNTGHSWHFTASYMGESPAGVGGEIDSGDRLRRMYYAEAPERYRRVRLGHAVAASACVPGLFEPITFDGLYPDRVVKLVDGGVSDNQGVAGLLEQDCNVLLISDGSGQMESSKEPSSGTLGVPLRATSILQARVREAQYEDLCARRRSQLLRGLMFVHLKQDLDVDPVDWVDCLDPSDVDDDDARPASRRGRFTSYGIAKDIQQRLASVRTDLDSFSDVEAYALMTSGYRQTEYAFAGRCVEGFDSRQREGVEWDFLAVEGGMRDSGPNYKRVSRLLAVSGSLAFKIWKLKKSLQVTAFVLSLLVLVAGAWATWVYRDSVLLGAVTVRLVFTLLLGVGFLAFGITFVGKKLLGVERLREKVYRAAVGLVFGTLGWIAAWLHLNIFDKMFLREGSIENYARRFDVNRPDD